MVTWWCGTVSLKFTLLPGGTTMKNPNEIPNLDALADALAARLAARMPIGSLGPIGPSGEPDPELPPLGRPPTQFDGPIPQFQVGARVGIAGVEYTHCVPEQPHHYPVVREQQSLPLVPYKTLVARVYPMVRRGQFGGDNLTGGSITGELTLSIGDRVIYRAGPTSARRRAARTGGENRPQPLGSRDHGCSIPASASSVGVDPIEINCPLNFVVPAYYCRLGRIYATVRLWPVANGPMSSWAAVATAYLQLEVQAPNVCLVRVNSTDSAGNVNKPTDAQMLATTGLAERMLPFPYFETTILGTEVTSSAAFATAATSGGCNLAWSKLVADLNVTRIFTALFQLGDIVYGMVPQAAIPAGAGTINSGCGKGAGGGFVGFNPTFARSTRAPERPGACRRSRATRRTTQAIRITAAARRPSGRSASTPAHHPRRYLIRRSTVTSCRTPTTSGSRLTRIRTSSTRARYIRSTPIDASGCARSSWSRSACTARSSAPAGRTQNRRPCPNGRNARRARQEDITVSIDLLDGNRRVLATHHCMYVAPHGGGQFGSNCSAAPSRSCANRGSILPKLRMAGADIAGMAFHQGEEPLHVVNAGEPPQVAIEGPERREEFWIDARTRKSSARRLCITYATTPQTTADVAGGCPGSARGLGEIETSRLRAARNAFLRAIGTADSIDTADTILSAPARAAAALPRCAVRSVPDSCGTR